MKTLYGKIVRDTIIGVKSVSWKEEKIERKNAATFIVLQ